MSDQCQHCTCHGNYQKCKLVTCRHHTNWFTHDVFTKMTHAAVRLRERVDVETVRAFSGKLPDVPDEIAYDMMGIVIDSLPVPGGYDGKEDEHGRENGRE